MAGKIEILSEEVINKIAAGEVVERPASIVKELIENSLDAGATHITIEIKGGGKKLILVIDDCSGMSREDAELALQRHATSKIRKLEDLQSITTLGFRGEALPSIAAVANLTLLTAYEESPVGCQVKVKGNSIEVLEAGCPPGTTVTVEDLFFNVPARLKFLKTDSTESGQITRVVQNFALSHPVVSFELKEDGRHIIKSLPGGQTLLERIASLYGSKIVEDLIPLQFDQKFLKISGFITKPEISYTNRQHQFLFVNKRAISSRLIGHAIWEGYKDFLPPSRHAALFLSMEIEPVLVDVNVHPTKKEVRFVNEPTVHTIVMQTIKQNLHKEVTMVGAKEKTIYPEGSPFQKRRIEEAIKDYLLKSKKWQESISPEELFKPKKFHIPELEKRIDMEKGEMFPLGQIDNLYIVARSTDGIVILDQHAAWERILYEQLENDYKDQKIESQLLLFPIQIELPPHNVQVLIDNIELFSKLGFEVEQFGRYSFLIKSTPHILGKEIQKQFIIDLIDEISDEVKKTENKKMVLEISSDIFKIMACRGAIMAGQSLSDEEMGEVVRRLNRCDSPHICPHGRPTMIKLTREELDRKFKRS
ncbi:DNA mismatch repair endonuclease MutL [bacterium]|nr:DNA mismatch repair endonuclease MutL [bacterium]